MAYTTPRTWTSTTLTAAQLNTDVRDNVNWLASDKPIWLVSTSVAQTIPHGTNTTLPYATESIDTANLHSTTTNPSRVTIATTGKYAVGAQISYDSNAGGYRQIDLLYNGTSTGWLCTSVAITGGSTIVNVSGIIAATAAGYLEVSAYHNAGVSIGAGSVFWGYWIGT